MVDIKFTEQWLDASTHNDKLCLYIGKTTNLRSRISMHLKLGTANLWKEQKFSFGIKPNPVSQLRIGLERVFKDHMRERMLNDVAVSWVKLNGNDECMNRFYIENLAIGKYFPLFNVDIER